MWLFFLAKNRPVVVRNPIRDCFLAYDLCPSVLHSFPVHFGLSDILTFCLGTGTYRSASIKKSSNL